MRKYYIGIAIVVAVSVAAIATYYLTFANTVRDVVKEQDISALSQSVSNYVTSNKQLPESLKVLKVDNGVKKRLDRYSYKKVGTFTYQQETQLRYELCTTFKSKSATNSSPVLDGPDSAYSSYADTYSHAAGPVCFKLYAYNPLSSDPYFPIEPGSTLPATAGGSSAGRDVQRKSDVRNLQTALELYFNDQGRYPAAETWKTDLVSGTTPYLKTIALDPTTHATYIYRPAPDGCTTTCSSYTLTAQLENKKDAQSDGTGHYIVNSAN